ncbi:NADH-quinone oxidoreductase subunit J [Singulisphaera sp. PoT]|uniref:NADH-quinone oxidoreductase subunit J family protein n=1 Tax=Singulisphaera sp. PoT TaxID=3411797 RepID=UPI003BF545E9
MEIQAQATNDLTLAMAVVVFGAVGTYLLMPHRFGNIKPRRVHIVGGILTALSVFLFARYWKPPGPFLTSLFFYGFGFTAIAGGILTISSRNPVYSALWFASVVLSTSGLFMLAEAQFLAVGTIIVYAGAIIVTFLFVIMLAQMEGRAIYDRAARSPFRSTLTCYLLFWALLYSLCTVAAPLGTKAAAAKVEDRLKKTAAIAKTSPVVERVIGRAVRPTALFTNAEGKPKPHVAGLGETLYTDQLLTVELAGALLFVALIGALSIATPKPPVRPGSSNEVIA